MVEVDALTYYYLDTCVPALSDVSFSVRDGEVLGVLGPVGAGKTTLCLCLAGLMPRVFGGRLTGRIEVGGLNPREADTVAYAQTLGAVLEDYSSQLTQIRVLDEVAAPLQNQGVAPTDAEDQARKLLDRVGLNEAGIEQRRTWELSGGQQQRIAIAGALAMQPQTVVLDSVTTMLDPGGKQDVRRLVTELADEQTLIVIDDDSELLAEVADRVLLLRDGEVAALRPAAELLRDHELLRACGVLPPVALRAARRLGLSANPLTVTELSEAAPSLRPHARPRRAEPTPAGPGRSHDASSHDGDSHDADATLRVEGATYTYRDGTRALRDANLTVQDGEVHGLLGGNGGGKSTLARVITGLLAPDQGSVRIDGQEISDRRAVDVARRVGSAFQNPDEMLSERTVRQELAFPLQRRRYEKVGMWRKRERYGDAYIHERVRAACDLAGLDAELLEQDPTRLPFGQRKLVTLAMAVVIEPRLVVFDEPGTGLDTATRDRVGALIRRLADRGVAVIIVEHEIDLVGEITDHVSVMANGEIIHQGPTREVFHPNSWAGLADVDIRPPRVARLGAALGVEAMSLDELVDGLEVA